MTIITLVRLRRALLVAIVVLGLVAAAPAADRLDRITLPPGFTIEVFSDAVPGARSMALSPAGTLFVGTREKGVVYAIPGAVGATHAATPRRIARGLTSREIAERLVISERTADAHVEHIRTKLGLHSRLQIAAWAVEQGLAGCG